MTGRFRVAVSLFTVIPAGVPAGEFRPETAAAALLWLPAIGAAVAAAAAAVQAGVQAGGHSAVRMLLAATLAVAVLAIATGCLHLDGLADTADGLGSRRRGSEALAIMRRPDVGPMGVAALTLVLLAQITALAAIAPGWPGAAALVLAAGTGRVAVLLAAGTPVPAARPDGFGALVAGTAGLRARVTAVAALLAAAGAGGGLLAAAGRGGGTGWLALAVRGLAAALAGLLAGDILRRVAVARLGGTTGDVFGAIIELASTITLVTLALT